MTEFNGPSYFMVVFCVVAVVALVWLFTEPSLSRSESVEVTSTANGMQSSVSQDRSSAVYMEEQNTEATEGLLRPRSGRREAWGGHKGRWCGNVRGR